MRREVDSGHRREGEDAQGERRLREGRRLGPVVSKNAKQRILGLIEEGVKAGAKLELDGRDIRVPGYEKGNFIGPTIFSGVTPDM